MFACTCPHKNKKRDIISPDHSIKTTQQTFKQKHRLLILTMTSTNQPSRKLHIIMEAASALSALGDDDSPSPTPISTPQKMASSSNPTSEAASTTKEAEEKSPSKRFIPSHKKPDAALTFPEKVSNHGRHKNCKGEEKGYQSWRTFCYVDFYMISVRDAPTKDKNTVMSRAFWTDAG